MPFRNQRHSPLCLLPLAHSGLCNLNLVQILVVKRHVVVQMTGMNFQTRFREKK